MSGRWVPSSERVVTWSSKSQRSTMPESRATFLSVVSPHEPRTCGLRSALTSVAASRRMASPASRTVRTCDRISVAIWTRSFSTSVSRAWNSLRLAATGASICSVACRRSLAVVSTDLRCCSATSCDSSRNCSTIACLPASISSARLLAASRWVRATATSACGPRCGDPGVRELLVHPGELTRVGPRRLPAPEQHADRQAGGQGEDREQCGGHAGIVTHGTDRTLEPTPGGCLEAVRTATDECVSDAHATLRA